jgi:hypothetical protein
MLTGWPIEKIRDRMKLTATSAPGKGTSSKWWEKLWK